MTRKGIKKCEFCGPKFARYPHQTATRLLDGKPCCEACNKALAVRRQVEKG